jgi:ribosome biogenesis GTP-binding protein YsxC/EngB
MSDAAKQLVETVKLYRSEGKTLKVLGLMDEAMALDTVQDRTAAAGAVVQALLACGRAALACQVVERAEGENLRLASKLIVSVAKAVSIEQPRTAPPKKSGRVRGHKKLILRGSQEEEFDADDGVGGGQDGVDKCLQLATLLQGRGASSDWARARVYAAVVTGQLRAGRLGAAKATVEILRQLPVSLTLGAYKSMMREFARIQSLQGLLLVLDVMRYFGVEADAEVLEQVANVAVHEVEFVKGAVDMDTLPPEGVPEACFAGRSNVGKSSLVNMICNRKKLAFTSKTPGKTQEFNYFLVSGGRAQGVGAGAEKNVFHLVDLPGVGYAEVPTFKREAWKQFYRDYLSRRRSLRVLFQLIDSRHGALKDDLELMSLVSEVGVAGGGAKPFEHVIVLTKMDKREGMDVTAVLEMVRRALRETGCDAERTPIVFTSSSSKLGRDEMWRYLRLAAGMGEEEDVVQMLEPDAALRKRVGTEGQGGEGSKVKRKYQNAPKFKGLGKLLKKINPKL